MRALAPSVPARALLDSATPQGARALGFDADYGTIEPGKRARLLAVAIPDGVDDVEEYLVSAASTPDQMSLDRAEATAGTVHRMITRLRTYLSFVRFSHSVFALPFALAGALLAARHTPVTLAGRSAGFSSRWSRRAVAAMGFNRLVDARCDALNPRTANARAAARAR